MSKKGQLLPGYLETVPAFELLSDAVVDLGQEFIPDGSFRSSWLTCLPGTLDAEHPPKTEHPDFCPHLRIVLMEGAGRELQLLHREVDSDEWHCATRREIIRVKRDDLYQKTVNISRPGEIPHISGDVLTGYDVVSALQEIIGQWDLKPRQDALENYYLKHRKKVDKIEPKQNNGKGSSPDRKHALIRRGAPFMLGLEAYKLGSAPRLPNFNRDLSSYF